MTDDPIPIPVDPGESLLLTVEHRGRVVARNVLTGPSGIAVDVLSVHAYVTYREIPRAHSMDRRPMRLGPAALSSSVEDIAAWVAGDGTDAQRLALADGIRAGWHHRDRRAALEGRLLEATGRSVVAWDTLQRLMDAAGEVGPDPHRWSEALKEAVREVHERVAEARDPAPADPWTPTKRRLLPPGTVPVAAEDVCGAAARIADLEYRLARAEARLAEELARRAEERARRVRVAEWRAGRMHAQDIDPGPHNAMAQAWDSAMEDGRRALERDDEARVQGFRSAPPAGPVVGLGEFTPTPDEE